MLRKSRQCPLSRQERGADTFDAELITPCYVNLTFAGLLKPPEPSLLQSVLKRIVVLSLGMTRTVCSSTNLLIVFPLSFSGRDNYSKGITYVFHAFMPFGLSEVMQYSKD